MVRIVDVAAEAGVSPSTVSHVLSGKRPISEATRERVLEAVRRLNYVPNPAAQALRERSASAIGFYGSDISETFVARNIRGVERVARHAGYHLLFASGIEFDYDVGRALDFLHSRRLDGIILAFAFNETEPIPFPRGLDCPVVTINRAVPEGYHSVLPDNRRGGYEAGRHLLESGATRIGFIGGPPNRPASSERQLGLARALEEHGLALEERRVYLGDYSQGSGVIGLRRLLEADPGIDGVFCVNDFTAAGAINAATQLGRRVPEELKVLGYDDRDFAEFWPVPISTFSYPLEEMGQYSAELLLSLMRGDSLPELTHYIPSTLVRRRSTAS
ncbi:MAG TPA: LacI family DNA-binding transcriptional regulator [Spirochaetales bacterium]|nr:LacI family DNA-binding transcriptional regulator [Spirochaetales bacterium]HRY56158.1 LacI family DNA-binding transcriptional regulator [Spirochaetia bacterium]HRZ65629.1 LacI family DNA-binding transcriptional regulator [Spirochaetia bacterium]